jgi:hypothetical protein
MSNFNYTLIHRKKGTVLFIELDAVLYSASQLLQLIATKSTMFVPN